MKKVYFIAIALVVVMMAAVSCTGSPKTQEDSPVPEAPGEVFLPPEPADEFLTEEAEIEDFEDTDEFANIIDEDVDGEEGEIEEPVLAEEEPPAEDELLAEEPAFEEPEPPVAAAVPEPEPPPPPPPPPPATPPPTVTARPSPPPAAPRPATPPPAVTAPAPPPPSPPPAEEPPVAAQEPVREPVPRVIPELPNPTPAFRGRPDDEVVFSRTVRATAGQLVVVPFRGTGWVYLGETGSRRGIVYDSRRLDPEGQSFIFRTETPGEYALKFYRQDFIRDFILNDYVQVIVGDPPETAGTGWFNPLIDRGRVIAEPRWPTSLEEAQALRGNTQPPPRDVAAAPAAPAPAVTERPPAQPPSPTPPASPPAQTPPAQTTPAPTPPASPPAQQPRAQTPPAQTTPPPATPPPAEPVPAPPVQEPPVPIPELEPDEYLQKAKEEFNAGRIAAAIAYLDKFREFYPVESDEVLWLYGQFYEANSPSRNVLAALDCYRRLTQEYPQSSRYDAARRRIAYLQRYYINIQ